MFVPKKRAEERPEPRMISFLKLIHYSLHPSTPLPRKMKKMHFIHKVEPLRVCVLVRVVQTKGFVNRGALAHKLDGSTGISADIADGQ